MADIETVPIFGHRTFFHPDNSAGIGLAEAAGEHTAGGACADAKQVQHLARHSTAELTLGVYAHADASKFSATIDKAISETAGVHMRKALRLSGDVSAKKDELGGEARKERQPKTRKQG